MPIYEYECKHCGYVFEKMVAMKKAKFLPNCGQLSVCPKCGQLGKRIMSVSNFVLKGAGFYKNDYGSGTVSESTVKEEKD